MPNVHVDLAERSYDVLVDPALLGSAGSLVHSAVPGRSRVAVISDETVATLHARTLLDSLKSAGLDPTLHAVPAGEASKTLATFDHLESAARGGGGARRGGLTRFETVARAQDIAQLQDQENGNSGQDQELYHGVVHRFLKALGLGFTQSVTM